MDDIDHDRYGRMTPNAIALSHLSNSSKMITSFFPKRKREHPANESSSSKCPASACSASTVSTASSSSSAASKSNSASSSSSSASVSALLSHFPSSAEDVSWGTALKKTLESKQFENLSKFVEKERCVHINNDTWLGACKYWRSNHCKLCVRSISL